MAGDARAEPGQNTFYSHADHAGAEGIAGAFADTRGRQGAEGFVGRSAAGHQYTGIYGGRGAAVEWRNADERTAEEFFVHDPAAVGSGGSDHSVEFSSGDSGVENRAGAGVREYGGVQAGDFDAVDGDEDRGDFRAGWIAGGRAESGDGVGTRDGRRAGAESARARVVVYRVERGGLRAVCIWRGAFEENSVRDGREESGGGAGGRGFAAGDGIGVVWRLCFDGTALHGYEPRGD